MKVLTKEQVSSRVKSKTWASAKKLCIQFGDEYGTNPNVLLSIFAIETFYRPLWMRLIEYCVVFGGCIRSLLLKIPTKNRTIGRCQLGLATILNFYGSNHYQHSHGILISSIYEMRQIFSVLSKEQSIKILAYRLQPIAHRAVCIYPDLQEKQIRYIGEQFNGRYSYGMLLTEVFHQLEQENAVAKQNI